MDSVIFDGVEYIRAAVIAKQFHYTQDYIGQLCRGKKVDARLVGRTWYVNPKTLLTHKTGRYKGVSVPTTVSGGDIAVTVLADSAEKIIVKEPVALSTVKAPAPAVKPIQNPEAVVTRQLRVFYEKDDESLIPHLIRKELPEPTSLTVEPANATKIHVESPKSEASFKAESLPEVYLHGNLKVTEAVSISEPEEVSTAESEQPSKPPEKEKKMVMNKAISVEREMKMDIVPSPGPVAVVRPPKPSLPKVAAAVAHAAGQVGEIKLPQPSSPVTLVPLEKPKITNAKLSVKSENEPEPISFENLKDIQVHVASGPASMAWPATIVVSALVCALVIVTLTVEIVVAPPYSQLGFAFRAHDLLDFLGGFLAV